MRREPPYCFTYLQVSWDICRHLPVSAGIFIYPQMSAISLTFFDWLPRINSKRACHAAHASHPWNLQASSQPGLQTPALSRSYLTWSPTNTGCKVMTVATTASTETKAVPPVPSVGNPYPVFGTGHSVRPEGRTRTHYESYSVQSLREFCLGLMAIWRRRHRAPQSDCRVSQSLNPDRSPLFSTVQADNL